VTSPLPDAFSGKAERFLPPALIPFSRLARWDRPIGWQLLLLPALQSMALAAGGFPTLSLILLFTIGAIAMRGAGSTYNDILDRDLDAKVERTRGRPLPARQVRVQTAVLFVLVQAFVGLVVLLMLNGFTSLLGLASLLPVALYPLMKRITSFPQLVLGVAFGWGVLMGWSAVTGSLSTAPVLLYAGTCCWIIGYDTIYALQDIEDDEKAGIGSSARLFGAHVREAVACLYVFASLLTGLALLLTGANVIAFLGLFAFAAHLFWQVGCLKRNGTDPVRALTLFRSNRDAGLWLLLGLLLQGAA
jgi:4-hydroxybenzoate polyprenyltransferase